MFDPDCLDLAEHFLQDEPYTRETATVHEDRVHGLAQAVQNAAELWIAEHPYPGPDAGRDRRGPDRRT